jgi:hypothetical protein
MRSVYGPEAAGGRSFSCQRPSAPVMQVTVWSASSIRISCPGLAHPQRGFGLPRWRTMWSPKSGLTRGNEVAEWSAGPTTCLVTGAIAPGFVLVVAVIAPSALSTAKTTQEKASNPKDFRCLSFEGVITLSSVTFLQTILRDSA